MRLDFLKPSITPNLHIEDNDDFFSLIKICTQLMNGGVLWSGGRERDPLSMQGSIEALTKPRVIVLDTYASACDMFLPWQS